MKCRPLIYVGIDDTDTLETHGTNQLARALARRVSGECHCQRITRHQLLDDPRVPYTSKNGSASLVFEPIVDVDVDRLVTTLAAAMRDDYISGSDPGLCVALEASESVRQFGRRCQRELVAQREARLLATSEGIRLLGLGGTEDGVIGALAAVGLAADGNDGRVVQLGQWEDLSGVQPLAVLRERGVAVLEWETGQHVESGLVDVGKKLRPNWRGQGCRLYVRRSRCLDDGTLLYQALKLP